MDFATGAMGTLIPKLGMLLKEEYDLQKSVKGGIKFLMTEFESMQAILDKVSGVPAEQLDKNTRIWARDVREMSYDIEDIIDTFLVRVESKKQEKQHKIKSFVDSTLNSLSNIKRRHKMANKIKDFECRVKEVKERHDRYQVACLVATPTSIEYVDPRLEALYKKVSDLVGIDTSMRKLINMLDKGGESSNKNLRSVSVVGIGGLGKTTLAKAVYDKLSVEFNYRAFVSVGQNPDVKKVLKDILLELDRKEYKDIHNLTRDVKQLVDLLREFLDNKRYIIVIDDIWDELSWKTIKLALVENHCGSRLIITTRKFDVAKQAGDIYILEPLSSDYSRQLLYARILSDKSNCLDLQEDNELTDKILDKCGGIPLAIITMASLLAGKTRKQWFEVFSSISLNNKCNSKMDTTMKILSLSYYDMPSHLRTCLLYLSVFPEDSIIPKKSLIWMWVAEGFIHSELGVGLFDLGERYFNALVNRSMIQPVKREDYSDHVYGCCLHDMVLELIRSLAHQENFVTILDNEQGTLAHSNVRRLYQQNMRIEHNPKDAMGMIHLRSFVAHSCSIVQIVPFSSFKVLRVLVLGYCGAHNNDHVAYLGELVHLRYLELKGSHLTELLKGIGALKCLQTLDLSRTSINELPSTVSMLTQLLFLHGNFKMETGKVIGKLTSLQQLHVQEITGKLAICEVLSNLRELRVLNANLGILDNSEQEALLDSLPHMHKLQYVKIHCHPKSSLKSHRLHTEVFSQHLQVLSFHGLKFSTLPTCISSSVLPKLLDLLISVDFIYSRDMRIIGKFPELCRLDLQVTSTTLLVVYGGDGYFRKLRYFRLHWNVLIMFKGRTFAVPVMPNLEYLSFGLFVGRLKNYCIHCHLSASSLFSMIGWNHLPSLKNVHNRISKNYMPGESEVEKKLKVALYHAANSHPNIPTFGVADLPYQPPWESREVLDLPVHVWMFRDMAVRFDLTSMALLEKVTAHIYCLYATPGEVLQVEAALRHAVRIHPNRVILEMERHGENEMDVLFTGQEEEPEDCDATAQDEEHIAPAAAEVQLIL